MLLVVYVVPGKSLAQSFFYFNENEDGASNVWLIGWLIVVDWLVAIDCLIGWLVGCKFSFFGLCFLLLSCLFPNFAVVLQKDSTTTQGQSGGENGKFDYDLVVIGGGSGGLAASKEAARLGIDAKGTFPNRDNATNLPRPSFFLIFWKNDLIFWFLSCQGLE